MYIYNAMCDILSYIILIKHGYGSICPNNKYQYTFRDIRIKMRILPPHFLCEKGSMKQINSIPSAPTAAILGGMC